MVWIRYDEQAAEEVINIIVYSDAYSKKGQTRQITQAYPIEKRDLLGKKVSSQNAGSYMVSDSSVLPYEQKITSIKADQQAVESRGLWKMKGDFMGGPFINYTFNDPKNGQTIVVDGFIYAPKSKKRLLVRRLEALFKSIDLIK